MRNLTLLLIILFLCNVSYSSYESAYSKYLNNDIPGAVAEITKDILNNTKDPRLYFLMIKINKEKTKDYNQAVEYAIDGMKLFPENAKEFMLELSDAYILSGKFDKAEPLLVSYNNLYPGDPNCLYLLGKNYYSQKKYYRALVSFEASRSFGRNDLDLLEILGITYSQVGNYQKALEFLSYVYNQTKNEKILAKIIEMSSILGVDYSSYITVKVKLPELKSQSATKVSASKNVQSTNPIGSRVTNFTAVVNPQSNEIKQTVTEKTVQQRNLEQHSDQTNKEMGISPSGSVEGGNE
ncbi:MAG: tetratricopeptide repeat protein [Brevinematia bacterium]